MLTARQQAPSRIPRDRAWTLSLDVYLDGASATPTVGNWVLRDPSGNVVLEKTPSLGATSTVSILATDLANKPYDVGYVEEWSLTVGGVAYPPIRRDAYIVRSDLYPTITTEDLYSVLSVLEGQLPRGASDYQSYIDEAWNQIISRLVSMEAYPQVIVSSWAFRTTHIYWSLALIAEDFSQEEAGEGKWSKAAERYRAKAVEEFDMIQFRVDRSEEGGSDLNKDSTSTVLYTTGPQKAWWVWTGRGR